MDIWDGTDLSLLRDKLWDMVRKENCRSFGIDLRQVQYIPSGFFGTTQGNALYVNDPDAGTGFPDFSDEAATRGVDDTYWGWGTEFIDVDNDGDLDLAAVTGFDVHVLAFKGPAWPLYTTPSVLFVNDGTGSFTRELGAGFDTDLDSRGLVAFDYDRDGDRDLLITNVNQPLALLENTTSNPGHWLDVTLLPDAEAIGARVYVTVAASTRRRDVVSGHSFLAGGPREVHFGLGAATTIDTLRVVWADGSEQTLASVAADQLVTVQYTAPVSALPPEGSALAVVLLLGAAALALRRGARA